MANEGWRGLSVLYVCPLRALLNNLEPRLHGYATMLGRRASLWHGDVADTVLRRMALQLALKLCVVKILKRFRLDQNQMKPAHDNEVHVLLVLFDQLRSCLCRWKAT
jgi:hypothetical protein